MSKCVVTGKDTLCKVSNIPVSCEGRKLLKDILVLHNSKIFDFYKERNRDSNNGIDLDDDTLKRFAPKINIKKLLGLLAEEEKDVIETLKEVLEA